MTSNIVRQNRRDLLRIAVCGVFYLGIIAGVLSAAQSLIWLVWAHA